MTEERNILTAMVEEIERVESGFDFLFPDFACPENEPEWAQNVLRELLKTMCPAAELKRGCDFVSPGRVGALLGHKLAFTQMMMEMPLPDDLANLTDAGKNESESEKEKWADLERNGEEHTLLIASCLALASMLPREDARRFFKSFHKALEKGPADWFLSNLHRSNTRIYLMLWWGRKSVPKVKSVRQLHQALCHYLGTHVVGDMKRVEKICQRIGLSFGPPGRPKSEKEGNSDTAR